MIVVIADDLTGAAELAGVALRHGLSAEVQTVFDASSPADVVCVDTDTRLLPLEEAAARVTEVARNVVAAKPAWIFKKCDSVLRGPVLAEARALAAVTEARRILVLPANPSRQRIIRGGLYFVDGRPLNETGFAQDPGHPRKTAQVQELLGSDLAGVETPDAETGADIARQAAVTDRKTLPVGAADFFGALLQVRHPSPPAPLLAAASLSSPALLVCGSAASWAQRRADASAHGIPVFARPYDLEEASRALRSSPLALIGIGEVSGVPPAVLSHELASAVTTLVMSGTKIACLLLEGGATARAVVNRRGWRRLEACPVAAPGVGVLRPAGEPGPLLFIKPGSYPWPAEIWPGKK